MINAIPYTPGEKEIWDNFIESSKNGTFMLKRGYMDYHADRFTDCSVLFYDDQRLAAVMPASIHGAEVRSHGGLTYGGIVSDKKMTTPKMLEVFQAMKSFFKDRGVQKIIYKCIPSVYHLYPADEDLYALFINNAKLVRRDVSTAILQEDKIRFSELRRRGAKKAVKNGLAVKSSDDFETYVSLLGRVLEEHHGAKPVHTAGELKKLAAAFPKNIKLYAAFDPQNEMQAGAVVFDTPQTLHTQYIANSSKGREIGALDLVMDELINTVYADKKYFDFGISTEDGGRYMNAGLISQKEMFGGRAVVYDFYEMETA